MKTSKIGEIIINTKTKGTAYLIDIISIQCFLCACTTPYSLYSKVILFSFHEWFVEGLTKKYFKMFLTVFFLKVGNFLRSLNSGCDKIRHYHTKI
jgi:hypothetical protein